MLLQLLICNLHTISAIKLLKLQKYQLNLQDRIHWLSRKEIQSQLKIEDQSSVLKIKCGLWRMLLTLNKKDCRRNLLLQNKAFLLLPCNLNLQFSTNSKFLLRLLNQKLPSQTNKSQTKDQWEITNKIEYLKSYKAVMQKIALSNLHKILSKVNQDKRNRHQLLIPLDYHQMFNNSKQKVP